MNITTKFQPGDVCFRIHNNKVQQIEVAHVTIEISRDNLSGNPEVLTRYNFRDENDRRGHEQLYAYENEVFVTKAELLASL